MAGQGPSFKTDIHRNKTRKWVEAPRNDYGGDDWGVADEYNEYGTYDEEETPQAPQAAAAPQLPTGFRHHGQSASIGSAKGRASYEASIGSGRGRASYEAPNGQPTLPSLQRTNSFDAGDERHTFSAVTSPAVAQGETLHTLPSQSFESQVRPAQLQQDQSYESYHSAQSQNASYQTSEAFSQHMSPRFQFQHTEPSHEPEYDDRDYSDNGGQAGLGLTPNADEDSQRHSFLPPLRSEVEEDPYHYQMPGNHNRLPPYPPRKSSLTTRSRPDLNELYQAQQAPNHEPLPGPGPSHYGPSFGSSNEQAEETTRQEENAPPARRIIAPHEIYQRMEEEKEKARRASDASRRSPERPEVQAVPEATPLLQSVHEEPSASQQDASSRISASRSDEASDMHFSRNPEIQSAPASNDHTDQLDVSSPTSHSSKPSLLGFTISNPTLAHALGADAQEDTQPAQRSIASDPSPILPSLGRFSGFGSLVEGIWHNQSLTSGNDVYSADTGRQSMDKASTRSQSPNKPQPLNMNHEDSHTDASTERRFENRQSYTHPTQEANSASHQNPSVRALGQDTIRSESPLGSPTDYYFTDQAGSMDDRLYNNQEDEGDIGPSDIHSNQHHTSDDYRSTMEHNRRSFEERGKGPHSNELTPSIEQSSAELSAPGRLPDSAQAITRAELDADERGVGNLDLGDFEGQREDHRFEARPQSLNEHDELSNPQGISGDSAAHSDHTRAELGAPAVLPQPAQALSRHELDGSSATDDEYVKPGSQQHDHQAHETTHAPNSLHLATSQSAHDAQSRDPGILKNVDRVNSMRDEHMNDYSPSIYTPQSARSGLETRETDLAAAMISQPEDRSSDIAHSARMAQASFLNMRQPPAPIQSRFLQQPQSDPISRATSPGGRVKELAGKFDEIHTLSRQSTIQSPTGSASGRRERGGHDSDDVGNTSSLRSNQDFERPRLPGEWISYADTIESTEASDDERGNEEDETGHAGQSAHAPLDDEMPTPTAERPESPIDFSPNTKKKSLYGATSTEETEGPMATLAAAGHALASSLQSMVGIKTDDDDEEDDRRDYNSDATESQLPTPDITPDVNNRHSNSFQHQPSSLAEDIPSSPSEELTIEHARQQSSDEHGSRIEHVEEHQVEESDIANFDHVAPRDESVELPSEHEMSRAEEDEEDEEHDDDDDRDVIDEYDDEDDEPVASPAPLRPHSHANRTAVETMSQRPIWPSQASAMSINYSPDDTQSDQLRKDIIRSLSPNPESSRKSIDIESNPRSSTEYPQFSAIPDTTPERKLASTPLHLSPPSALAVGGHAPRDADSSIDNAPKTNFLTVQPTQPAGGPRESTLLPQIYDSYWADRDSQDDDQRYSRDANDRPVSQTISALSSVREDRTPETGALHDESSKSRDNSPSRPNYLAQRFSWEGQDEGSTSSAAPIQQPTQHATGNGERGLDSHDLDNTRADKTTNGIDLSDTTTVSVPSHDQSHNVPESPPAMSPIPAPASLPYFDAFPQPVNTSVHNPRSPSDDTSSASPAQYKYERPFQRTPSENAGTRTGLRKTSTAALHPPPFERSRTVSSAQFSIPGETSLSGFKTIASIRDTPDRITAFDRTREGFANLDTGLNQWLTYMVRANPELLDDSDTPIKRSATTGFAGSMRHKLAPSINKLTRTNDNMSTSSIPESSMPSMSTRSPSMTKRTPSTSEAGSSKGKAFLQSAGQGAKGFFSKSKSKMRGASGQQKAEPPLLQSRPLARPVLYTAATHGKRQEPVELRESSASATPIWAAHSHTTPAAATPQSIAPSATRNENIQPARMETPTSDVSETGVDVTSTKTLRPLSSPGKPQFSSQNEDHARDNGLPSTRRDFWEALAGDEPTVDSPGNEVRSVIRDERPSITATQTPDITLDDLPRAISPLQAPFAAQGVSTRELTPPEERPISPISAQPTDNFQSFPILPITPQPVPEQIQSPQRRSLALEKQDSVAVSEMEIHPALLGRSDSSYSVAKLLDGASRTTGNGSKEHVPAVPALPAVGSGRRSGELRGFSLPITSVEAGRQRSKSPFARWRNRSKSRDAHATHGGGQSFARDLYTASASAAATSIAGADLRRSTVLPSHPSQAEHDESPSGAKKKSQSPFRFRFRSRSRSRVGSIHGAGQAVSDAKAHHPLPTSQSEAIAQAPSTAAPDQSQSPRGRPRSRDRNKLRKKSVSANGLAQSSQLDLQNGNAGVIAKEKRRSWYGGSIRPSLPGAGSEMQAEKRRSWYSRSSSIGTMTMTRTNTRPSLPGRSETEGKRRSWYGGLLCHDDRSQNPNDDVQGSNTPGFAAKAAEPDTPARPAARYYGPVQTDGTTPAQDVERRARSRSASTMNRIKHTSDIGLEEREKHLSYLRESAPLFPARNNAQSTNLEGGASRRSFIGPEPLHGSQERRLSGQDGGRGTDNPYYSPPSSPQAARQQHRPWATPKHARQNPVFLEHKQRRLQQEQSQHAQAQSLDMVSDAPQPKADLMRTKTDITTAQADIRQSEADIQREEADVPKVQAIATPSCPAQTQPQIPVSGPSLPHHDAHNPRPENSATQLPRQPVQIPTTKSTATYDKNSAAAQPQREPILEIPIKTSTHSPLPQQSQIPGLPIHLSHLSLNLSPPTSPTPSTTLPAPNPSSGSIMQRGRPPRRPRASSLAGSVATSVNVNIGHHDDNVPVPPLPAAVLIATTPLHDTSVGEQEDEVEETLIVERRRNDRGGGGAIARWRDGVAEAGADQSPTPQWPLSDDGVVDEVGVAQREGKYHGRGDEAVQGVGDEDGAEDVVLSPTLDGPGWEWQPVV